MNALDRAVAGSAGAPLTSHQRQQMCALAHEAWTAKFRAGHAGADFEAWRHEEQFKACHKESLRAATQADWPRLRAHFLRLLGRVEQARALEQRSATGNRPVAWGKLQQTAREVADVIERPLDYAGRIAAARFKRPLTQLNERELWTLVFDLRRNAQRRRAARRSEVRGQRSADPSDLSHPTYAEAAP